MRAFVINGPGAAAVEDVPEPEAAPDEVIVDVRRVGICGTDVEFYTGEMQYLHDGNAAFPMRIGHEWTGLVSAVGDSVDPAWLGKRVTGDTMLGCGRCQRCRTGHQHVCNFRTELGIRGGRAGALADRMSIPARALLELPDVVDDTLGALVEPGGNALRAVRGAGVEPGARVLVLGPGTIGLLVAMFARASGAEVHLLGKPGRSSDFAATLGFDGVWTEDDLPTDLAWDAVVDASNAEHLPARAVELVEPAGRVVFVGLAGTPSLVDSRALALKDVTAVGVLSASGGLQGTIDAYATGVVDPRPLVAAAVPLEDLAGVFSGTRSHRDGAGPKTHVVIDGAAS